MFSVSFSLSNLAEWTPMTTSSLAYFFSSFARSGRMWMQLMQQKVQKSSRTILPRRSFSRSGPAVLSQATPPRAPAPAPPAGPAETRSAASLHAPATIAAAAWRSPAGRSSQRAPAAAKPGAGPSRRRGNRSRQLSSREHLCGTALRFYGSRRERGMKPANPPKPTDCVRGLTASPRSTLQAVPARPA